MARKKKSITDQLTKNWATRAVFLALIVEYFLISYLEESLIAPIDYAFAAIVMVATAFVVSTKVKVPNLANAFGLGFISYGAYVSLLTFLKLTDMPFVFTEEVLLAISFGIVTMIIYFIMGLIEQ